MKLEGTAVVVVGATGSRDGQRPPEGLRHLYCLPEFGRCGLISRFAKIGPHQKHNCIKFNLENEGTKLISYVMLRVPALFWS